jgi:hypothetical protein
LIFFRKVTYSTYYAPSNMFCTKYNYGESSSLLLFTLFTKFITEACRRTLCSYVDDYSDFCLRNAVNFYKTTRCHSSEDKFFMLVHI